VSQETKERPSTFGVLTDEGIERLRKRIGIYVKPPTVPHNYEVTWDGVRHFALGYGDSNPLWCDPEYGKTTRWGGLIAPPNFLYTMGEPIAPEHTPEQKAILKGDPLIGLGAYQAVMEFEWWRPLRLQDRLRMQRLTIGVQVKEKSAFSGRSVIETRGFIFRNQNDELHCLQKGAWVRAERHASKEKKKEAKLPETYTAEQLAEIDACYEAETRRGAEPRYWEDVEVGDELQTIVKGPMRVSDLIVWHLGWGMQLTPPGAFGETYKIRKKVPGMYTPNPLGVPDTIQRLHWEKERANELGIPLPYDYGALRETFLTNLITNWMGDNGWLWKMSCQHRVFCYMGDTYWVKGKVTGKREENGHHVVDLNVWVENQWGVITTPGDAVVILPTRDAPIELPRPARENVEEMIQYEIDRLAAQS
jgi:acyl dehydratase